MTATAFGQKNGRIDAAIATRSRQVTRSTLAAVGNTEKSNSTTPTAARSSTAKPESRNTSRMGRLSLWVTAQKCVKPFFTASKARRSSSSVPSPLPCRESSTAKATSALRGSTERYEAVATICVAPSMVRDDQCHAGTRIARIADGLQPVACGGRREEAMLNDSAIAGRRRRPALRRHRRDSRTLAVLPSRRMMRPPPRNPVRRRDEPWLNGCASLRSRVESDRGRMLRGAAWERRWPCAAGRDRTCR